MSTAFSKDEWKEILKELYRRATSDLQFRKLCLENANEAIKQICGKDLPEELKIRFSDQEKEVLLTLPSENKNRSFALSDEQLSLMACGMTAIPWGPNNNKKKSKFEK